MHRQSCRSALVAVLRSEHYVGLMNRRVLRGDGDA
jgi:hypothetical protein